MPNQVDNFWMEMSGRLRRAAGLDPLTPEEAEREFQEAERAEIPDEVADALRQDITAGRMRRPELPSPNAGDEANTYDVESEVLQLNRKAGNGAGAEELIRKHRREALDESKSDGTNR